MPAFRLVPHDGPNPFVDPNVQPVVFGGEKGATNVGPGPQGPADIAAARMMAQQGKNSDQIFASTGWYRGADGQWKWVLSDKNAEIKQNAFITDTDDNLHMRTPDQLKTMGYADGQLKLKDILDHPDLFKAYPDLAEYKIGSAPGIAAERAVAAYDHDNKTIQLGAGRNKEEILGSLLHELQHGIQKRENFGYSSGGPEQYYHKYMPKGIDPKDLSPQEVYEIKRKAYEDYRNQSGETEAFQVTQQYKNKNWDQPPDKLPGFAPPAEQSVVRADDLDNRSRSFMSRPREEALPETQVPTTRGGQAQVAQPFDTTLSDPITKQDQSDIATHRMNPNLEPQYRQPMRDIPTGRDIQNRYDSGATIRPGRDEGGPAPAYGDPSPWNQPPPPVGVEGGGGWSYSGQRKPFIQNPMGGQVTVPVYRTPLGQRSDAGPAGYDLHEINYTPVFPKDPQTASAPPKMIDPYMEAVKLNAPTGQAIPIQSNPNWQMSAYGNPTSQQTDDRFSFTPTQALNIYQPMSNTNGVPTYG